jgi:hypothetical protein
VANAPGQQRRPPKERLEQRPAGQPSQTRQGPVEAARERIPASEQLRNRPEARPDIKAEPRPERTERPEPVKERKETRERPEPRERQIASAPDRSHRWEKKVKAEETFDDIHRDNERLEKEIWLEIASIHNIKLDF